MQQARNQNTNEVIERELVMFLNVKNEGGQANCQENPEMFRHWRWMIFSVLSDEYIESYLQDLINAEERGRNLLMEKYARMDNLIPCVSPNIEKVMAITSFERQWLLELIDEFPLQFSNQIKRFDFYFAAEVETLSEKTLDCYLDCIKKAKNEGRNLAKERYENINLRLNYPSLSEKELQLQKNNK